MKQLTGNYTLSLDICVGQPNSLESYCWTWAFANGTDRYVGLVNAAGNKNWYYEIKNGTAEHVYSQRGLTPGTWHTLTAVHRGGGCYFYIDGERTAAGPSSILPSQIAGTLTQCWLGRSPFSADAYMTNALIDNFRIYNKSLTADEVRQLYEQRPTTTKLLPAEVGIEARTKGKARTSPSAIFDLQGRLVSVASPLLLEGVGEASSVLLQGIYIKDGKKVVVH
jgi:hypothetical protein